MGDSEQNLSGAPWWARLSVIFGVPTVLLAAVLFGAWQLINDVGAEMVRTMKQIQTENVKHSFDTGAVIQTQQALVNVVRANCVNNAKNEEGIRRCMQ